MATVWRWHFCGLGLVLLQACSSAPRAPNTDGAGHTVSSSAIPTCTEVGQEPGTHRCVYAPREADALGEDRFREAVGEPAWRDRADGIGLSLSGGGTRSAASAMGVLAAFDDLKLLSHVDKSATRKVDIISSVSGGGYAAYFLFSHLMHEASIGVARGELFQDCVSPFDPDAVHPNLLTLLQRYYCINDTYIKASSSDGFSAWNGDGIRDFARHQALIRCHQDVMYPGRCSSRVTSKDRIPTGINLAKLLGGTFLSLPFHHLINSLFDSGANISPSRASYVAGIRATYGALIHPDFDPRFQRKKPNGDGYATRTEYIGCATSPRPDTQPRPNYALYECDPGAMYPAPLPQTMQAFSERFDQLTKNASADGAFARNYPYWVIQSTGAPTRGIVGWLMADTNKRSVFNDTFEITPKFYGSSRYGFVPGTLDNFEVLDAVASSAAFLDSNQTVYTGAVLRPTMGAVQHVFNANWGIDIENYNVPEARVAVHRMLPFPLNTLDALASWALAGSNEPRIDRLRSAYIRLMDGGNSENLGAYAQIRRGVKNIVISDGAEDLGEFADVCHLKVALATGLQKTGERQIAPAHLYLPGLHDFDRHCQDLIADKGKDEIYNMRDWQHDLPVFLGCVQTQEEKDPARQCMTTQGANVTSRLYVYKPSAKAASLKVPAIERACKVVDYSGVAQGQAARSMLLRDAGGPLNCSTGDKATRSLCDATLPCETARLLRNLEKETSFPMGSTVFVTSNSSGTLFAAYRELARHALHGASQVILGETAGFEAALSDQTLPTKVMKRTKKK